MLTWKNKTIMILRSIKNAKKLFLFFTPWKIEFSAAANRGPYIVSSHIQYNYIFYTYVTTYMSSHMYLCPCKIQEMIDQADLDQDGFVNEQEFLRIISKTNLY